VTAKGSAAAGVERLAFREKEKRLFKILAGGPKGGPVEGSKGGKGDSATRVRRGGGSQKEWNSGPKEKHRESGLF